MEEKVSRQVLGSAIVEAVRDYAATHGMSMSRVFRMVGLRPNRGFGLVSAGRGLVAPERMMFLGLRLGYRVDPWFIQAQVIPPDIARFFLDPEHGVDRMQDLRGEKPWFDWGLTDQQWLALHDEAESLMIPGEVTDADDRNVA